VSSSLTPSPNDQTGQGNDDDNDDDDNIFLAQRRNRKCCVSKPKTLTTSMCRLNMSEYTLGITFAESTAGFLFYSVN